MIPDEDKTENMVRYTLDPNQPLTEDQKAELARLADMPDSEIDFSDIPELTEEDFKRMRPFREAHPELYASLQRNRIRLIPTVADAPPVTMEDVHRIDEEEQP
jgi:hypothetical protein